MTDSFVFSRDQPYQDTDIRPVRLRGLHQSESRNMATFFLGPLEAHDIGTIKHALEQRLESIEDRIDTIPVLTGNEAGSIAAEQARLGRLIDACVALALSE